MRLYHERPRNGHLEGLGGPKRKAATPIEVDDAKAEQPEE
jgi:8-oxo-dGTP diphosphatase